MFSHPFPNAFGLDIGDRSIKVVQLQNVARRSRTAAFRFKTAKTITLPEGLIINGELQQPEKIRSYIHHLLDDQEGQVAGPIKSPWVVASLPEQQGFIKLLTLPKPPNEILKEDILHAAKLHIPFDEETSYFDWQIIPHHGGTKQTATDVLIAIAPRFIADSITYLLESVGLGVIALEHESIAVARSMIPHDTSHTDEAYAVLDLGATRSSVIIFDHNKIQASISINFSGDMINHELMQELKVSEAEAEAMKRETGLVYSKKNRAAWGITKRSVDVLVDELKRALRFYHSHFPHPNPIARIALCGGGASMKKLPELLSLRLHMRCPRGNPWKNLLLKQTVPLVRNEGMGYATAVGLALRAADNLFIQFDDI